MRAVLSGMAKVGLGCFQAIQAHQGMPGIAKWLLAVASHVHSCMPAHVRC